MGREDRELAYWRAELLRHASAESQRIYAHADAAKNLAAMGSLAELMS